MLKYWRILILLVTVFGAIMAIGYGPPRSGVEIMYVSSGSPASGILSQGMIISSVNAQPVGNVDDWDRLTRDARDNITLETDAGKFTIDLNDSRLGVDVIDVQRLNLEFGLDLRGGTRITLTPTENATQDMIDEVVATLQTRANVYGLREIRFFSVRSVDGKYFIQIEAAGVGRDVVENLLSKQGKFEAKVIKPVSLAEGSGTLELGASLFNVSFVDDDTVTVDGEAVVINDTIILKNVDFELTNITNNQAIFLATVYDGSDIEMVKTDPQSSGIFPRGGVFQFYFVVLVSESGAQKFADVTTGIPSFVDFNTGERYLDSRILLYLDEQVVSDLQIGANLGGVIYTSPQIQGSRSTMEEAIKEKLELQSILRSGALPTTLETSSIQVISPTLGSDFFRSAGMAGMAAAAMVFVIVFIKYRKLKVALPMVFIVLSEILIILGIASTGDNWIWSGVLFVNFLIIVTAWWKKAEVDIFAWIGAFLIPLLGMAAWTIDLPAIGGILAVIGTGIDHQIIIADETLSGKAEDRKSYTMKEKVKRAFFIIFGASATTIAAMIPLISVGIGLVRGFAITTIIGVLVGILITRPAYARIIELTAKD